MFNSFLESSFPVNGKRTRSAVIHREYANRILKVLKDEESSEDKNFRHFVKKKSGFQTLDLPAAGLTNVLVVKVKEGKEVNCFCEGG